MIIPATLGLAISGIRLYKSIIKDRKKESIKIEILRTHTVLRSYVRSTYYVLVYRNVYINKSACMVYRVHVKKFKKNIKNLFTT